MIEYQIRITYDDETSDVIWEAGGVDNNPAKAIAFALTNPATWGKRDVVVSAEVIGHRTE